MRRLIPTASFSRWSLPVRFLGLSICLLGFLQIFAAAQAAGIVVAVIGSIIWQASVLLEWWSPEFQRLNRTPASGVMRTERIDVPASWNLGKLLDRFPDSNQRRFFVAQQDGYELGIALPEQFRNVSEDDTRYLRVGQVSRPISSIDSIRDDDSLLAAYSMLMRNNRDWVTVMDCRSHIVGVVAREDLQSVLQGEQGRTTSRRPLTSESNLRNVA